jgi:hypothetical protein
MRSAVTSASARPRWQLAPLASNFHDRLVTLRVLRLKHLRISIRAARESFQAFRRFLRAKILGPAVPNSRHCDIRREPQFSQFFEHDGIIGFRKHECGARISCFCGPLQNQSCRRKVPGCYKGVATRKEYVAFMGVDPAQNRRSGGEQSRHSRPPFQAQSRAIGKTPVGKHERDGDVHRANKPSRRHDGRGLDLRGRKAPNILADGLADRKP